MTILVPAQKYKIFFYTLDSLVVLSEDKALNIQHGTLK